MSLNEAIPFKDMNLNHKFAVGPQQRLALVFEKQHWITYVNFCVSKEKVMILLIRLDKKKKKKMSSS